MCRRRGLIYLFNLVWDEINTALVSTVNDVFDEEFSCLVGASDEWPCHRVGKSHPFNAFLV
jgi:hypothetical protein